MFYSINKIITSGSTEADPITEKLEVSAGVIHQVDLIFPAASSREVYAQVFCGSYQFIPVNLFEAVRGDDMVISTREFYELTSSTNIIMLKAWNTGDDDTLLLGLNIGVLPKKILQPFSFEELLKAAMGVEL